MSLLRINGSHWTEGTLLNELLFQFSNSFIKSYAIAHEEIKQLDKTCMH